MKVRYLLLTLVSLVIVACGGGGGGGTSLATLVYTTDWTSSASPGGGVSQRVSVFDLQSRLLKSVILNKGASAVQVSRIEGVEGGT
ncbi:MAG: hypothetical protein ABL962_02555, partial [Fimbriimonadaceae bacterium]